MTESNRTGAANGELVRRIPTEFFAEGTVDQVDEPFATDFVGHVLPTPGESRGGEGFEQLVTAFRIGVAETWLDAGALGLLQRPGAVRREWH